MARVVTPCFCVPDLQDLSATDCVVRHALTCDHGRDAHVESVPLRTLEMFHGCQMAGDASRHSVGVFHIDNIYRSCCCFNAELFDKVVWAAMKALILGEWTQPVFFSGDL